MTHNTVPTSETQFLLTGGEVYTPSGWEEAVAIGGGKIIAIGESVTLRNQFPHFRCFDIAGKTVIPGLHDMHVHPLIAGRELNQFRFEHCSSPKLIQDALSEYLKNREPGEWITGGRWTAGLFSDKPPNRQMLDEVSPRNPVVLTDVTGHSTWANSLALQAAGITQNTPNPDGGIIERDALGQPNGLLREKAADLAWAEVPVQTTEQNAEALRTGINMLVSYGITCIVDALIDQEGLAAYQALSARHQLKAHVRGCFAWSNTSSFDQIISHRAKYASSRFKLDCVKIFLDGVPTDSHTAAMIEPYLSDEYGYVKDPQLGLLLLEPAELSALLTKFDKQGMIVKVHSVGDRASRTLLDAVAEAKAVNGHGGPAHELGHVTLIQPHDLVRASELRTTLEFSPYSWFPSPISDDILRALGPARAERAWPVREGLDSGALVIAGSDWPIVPSANPWIGIETLVTRKAPNNLRPSESFGLLQAITVEEAIDIFTINAARQFGYAETHGTIEVGKSADFIVLDRNPFKIPATDLHKVVVKQSFVDGELVHQT